VGASWAGPSCQYPDLGIFLVDGSLTFPTAVVGWDPSECKYGCGAGCSEQLACDGFGSFRQPIRLVDQARRLVHLPLYRPRAASSFVSVIPKDALAQFPSFATT
jgi:hypothetical protein